VAVLYLFVYRFAFAIVRFLLRWTNRYEVMYLSISFFPNFIILRQILTVFTDQVYDLAMVTRDIFIFSCLMIYLVVFECLFTYFIYLFILCLFIYLFIYLLIYLFAYLLILFIYALSLQTFGKLNSKQELELDVQYCLQPIW
jgi:hypothetical protein